MLIRQDQCKIRRSHIGGGLGAAASLLSLVCLMDPAKAEPAASAPPARASLAALPKPFAPGPAEAAHSAKLDAAIAPLRDITVPADESKHIRDAVSALAKRDVAGAQAARDQVRDPAARKLVDWFRLRAGAGTADEIASFLAENPTWPDRTALTERLEEQLFRSGSSETVRGAFKDHEPKTGAGLAALAAAMAAAGNTGRATALASHAWRQENFSAEMEPLVLAKLRPLLTQADHAWRFDRLSVDDLRWSGERSERAAQARRLIPLLSPGAQKRAEARLAVLTHQANALALMAALASDGSPDWGLEFHRAMAARGAHHFDEAVRIAKAAPVDPAKVANLDAWWTLRRGLAYDALNTGKPKLAYELIRDCGPLTVNPLKEQQFLAGWIAFRLLQDPASGERHFKALAQAADGPLSRARARYWLGRVYDARGDTTLARASYLLATKDGDTFHGMLARLKLEPAGRRPITIAPPTPPTAAQVARFTSLDSARAAVIARKAGLDAAISRNFLYQLRVSLSTEAEGAMVAHLSEALGDTQTAVRMAKTAIAQGQNLVYYGYPVHPFPAYTPIRTPPETAFLLGVARQETEFNRLTVSGAGAKGLLQVMTVTANQVCHDYHVPCDIPRLLSDTSYNTMMASAYIGDRMAEFRGSYILTLTGYNAGPGRTHEWLRQFGDPRDPNVDPIDWIERIPFQETREYVSKVLANTQMYRARLGQEATALRLAEDLDRGRGAAGPHAAVASQQPAE